MHKHYIGLLVLYNKIYFLSFKWLVFLLCQVVALSLSQVAALNFTTITSISWNGTMPSSLSNYNNKVFEIVAPICKPIDKEF